MQQLGNLQIRHYQPKMFCTELWRLGAWSHQKNTMKTVRMSNKKKGALKKGGHFRKENFKRLPTPTLFQGRNAAAIGGQCIKTICFTLAPKAKSPLDVDFTQNSDVPITPKRTHQSNEVLIVIR